MLLEGSSLREDRSFAFDDFPGLDFGGLCDGEGLVVGTGETAEGALKVESIIFKVGATWENAVVCDVTEFVSDVETKDAFDNIYEEVVLELVGGEGRYTELGLLKGCSTGAGKGLLCAAGEGIGLSAAGGIFFHICEFKCFSTMEFNANRNRSHRLSNT